MASTASAWTDATTRSMFSRVSCSFEFIASQLDTTVVEALLSWEAKVDSNAHLRLKSGLTPTTSTFAKV